MKLSPLFLLPSRIDENKKTNRTRQGKRFVVSSLLPRVISNQCVSLAAFSGFIVNCPEKMSWLRQIPKMGSLRFEFWYP